MPILVRCGTANEIARAAADEVENAVKRANRQRVATVGTCTGSSPEDMYEELIRRVVAGQLSFSRTVMVGLDEYVGLAKDDPRSYHYFMRKKLWEPCGVPEEYRFLPDSNDPAGYDATIRNTEGGKVDLWVIGIGRNGHIGFNEPGEPSDKGYFQLRTRRVKLTPTTRTDNAPYFGGDPESVPEEADTAGPATIKDASKIVMIVKGPAKADALARMIEGAVCPSCPASILQHHANVTVLADPAAVSQLRKTQVTSIA